MTMFIYAFVAVTVAIIASYFTFFENTKFKWGCIGKKDNDRVCFFALGQIAKGVIAIGQISIGVVTIGQLAVGLFCAIGQGRLAFSTCLSEISWSAPTPDTGISHSQRTAP